MIQHVKSLHTDLARSHEFPGPLALLYHMDVSSRHLAACAHKPDRGSQDSASQADVRVLGGPGNLGAVGSGQSGPGPAGRESRDANGARNLSLRSVLVSSKLKMSKRGGYQIPDSLLLPFRPEDGARSPRSRLRRAPAQGVPAQGEPAGGGRWGGRGRLRGERVAWRARRVRLNTVAVAGA